MRGFAAFWSAGLLSAALASAAEAPKATSAFDALEVRPDGTVDYTITISGVDLPELARPPAPDFSAFDVLRGASRGSSTQVSVVDGKMQSRRSLTYTWRLSPAGNEEGDRFVPAFSVQLRGRTVTVPAARLRVTMNAGTSEDRSRGRFGGSAPWDPFARSRPNPGSGLGDAHLEVVARVDDADVWLGQEVIVTHLVEFGNELVVRRFDPEPAEFPGFERASREVKHQGRRVGGRDWQEVPLAQWRLVPLTAGDKELPSRGYALYVQGRSRDFFDDFFGGSEKRIRRATRPVALRVRPLPGNAPGSFSGAVGAFQLETSVGADELVEGDGTSLRVVVKGTGNFAAVKPPRLELPPGVRAFEPELREDTHAGRDGQTVGAKIYEYPILVEAAGELELPGLEWSYFDPRSARYVTRRSAPVSLRVDPSEEPLPGLGLARGGRRVVETLDTDIHHLQADWSPQERRAGEGSWPAWFWPLVAAGPLLPVAVAALRLRERLFRRDPARDRSKRASTRARKRLSTAVAAAKEGRAEEAADGAAEAVGRFVLDRLASGGAEPVPVEVERLVAGAAGDELATRVRAHLEDCDFLRFAGGTGDPARGTELAGRARTLLGELERALDSAPRGPS